jgi:uncharacterized membrane protein YhaH (DUF805 family)
MSNVYAAPGANFSSNDPVAETKMFAMNGRIGRIRWIAYMSSLWILASVAIVTFIKLVSLININLALTISKALPLTVWLIPLLVSRRRLHDLGLSALYLIGVIIPFVNLYFIFMLIFKRGDEGNNEFGPEPAPNDRKVYLLAFIIPLIATIGIVAAVAIPAYQHYTKAARVKASSVSLEPQREAGGGVASAGQTTLQDGTTRIA